MFSDITLSANIYPALMLLIAVLTIIVNFWAIKLTQKKFKIEEMGKKLDCDIFTQYKSDHEKIHLDEKTDIKYLVEKMDKMADKTERIWQHLATKK